MTPSVVAPWWNEERHFLPQEYQTVIDLCLIQGYTRAEAARQLGQSPAAVHGLLYRARMKLKKQLVQRGAATGTAFVATQASAATVDRLAPLVAASAVQLLQQGASSLSPTLAALLARSATPWVVPVAALSCLVLGGLTWWGMAVAQPATIRNSLVESNPLVSLPLRTVVAPPVTEARPSQTGTPQQVSQQPSQAPLPQQERQGNDGPAHSAALPVPPADRVPTHGEITTLAKKLPTTSGLLNEGMLPLLPHVVTQKAGEVPFLLSIITSEQEYRDCTAKAPPVKIPNNVQVANDPAWDGGLYQVDWQREVLVVVVMRQRANSATLTSFEENWIPPDAQGVGHLLLHYARPDADVEQAPLVQYPYVMLKVRREKLAKVAVTVWQSGSKPDGVAPFITTK